MLPNGFFCGAKLLDIEGNCNGAKVVRGRTDEEEFYHDGKSRLQEESGCAASGCM